MFKPRLNLCGSISKPNDVFRIFSELASQVKTAHRLDASLFARPATVMRNWGTILDRFDIQTGSLQRCNCTFSTAARSLDSNVNFLDTKFQRFVRCLLSGALPGKRGTFPATFESTGTGTGPTKGLPFCIGNRHSCIVKSRLDVGDSVSHIPTDSTFFCFCHCLFSPLSCCVMGRFDFNVLV